MSTLRSAARFLVAGLALTGLASAQTEEEPGFVPLMQSEETEDLQQEMIRLFHEVERTLEAIDLELYDASAGRVPVPEGRESGMERLLRSSGDKSQEAVSGIERILEIAQQMGGQGGT